MLFESWCDSPYASIKVDCLMLANQSAYGVFFARCRLKSGASSDYQTRPCSPNAILTAPSTMRASRMPE